MLQVWLFIAPGLYSNEKRMAIPSCSSPPSDCLAGAAFNHYISFPYLMVFFASFKHAGSGVHAEARDVFGLYSKMLIGMGTGVPDAGGPSYFLAKMKLVTARFLVSNIKYALLIIFIAAAVITPSGRHEDADHLRRPDAWPLPPQYRNLPGSSGLSAALLPRPEPRPSCPDWQNCQIDEILAEPYYRG
jgi:hypothetical protein